MNTRMKLVVSLGLAIFIMLIGTVQAATHQSKVHSANAPAFPLDRWEIDYLFTDNDAGSDASIAFDPDNNHAPWVAYFDRTFGSLSVMHYVGISAGNCGPSNYWYCELVDYHPPDVVGRFTSIDIYPDTNPTPSVSTWKAGVSYFDSTHRALKYAECKCPPGYPCYWTVFMVDNRAENNDVFGQYTSLKFDSNGRPHIAYHNYFGDQDDVAVAHACYSNPGLGNCGDDYAWSCEGIVYNTNLPTYPSLDVSYENDVYYSYYHPDNGDLYYASFNGPPDQPNCDQQYGWWLYSAIDHPVGVDVGRFSSFYAPQSADDDFQVAYYDSTNGKLKYATGPGSSGNCGPGDKWICYEIDDMGVDLLFGDISLAVDDDGSPIIAYSNATEELAPLGMNIAAPVSSPPYGTCAGALGHWACGTLDMGNAYVDVGKYLSVGIKSTGQAMVVYSGQEIDYPGSYDLMYAYTNFWSFLPVAIK